MNINQTLKTDNSAIYELCVVAKDGTSEIVLRDAVFDMDLYKLNHTFKPSMVKSKGSVRFMTSKEKANRIIKKIKSVGEINLDRWSVC